MSKLDEIRNRISAWSGLESKYRVFLGNLDPKLIVEIGVDYGYSFFTLASDFPNAKVVGVDPYPLSGPCSVNHPDAKSYVQKSMKEFPNTLLLEIESKRAVLEFEDKTIDLIHIDAIHTYEAVTQDIELWAPKLKNGGIMMLHDTSSFPSVTKAFNELPGKKENIKEYNGLGFWYKE